MTDKPQEKHVEEDASERPGAIVIRPERNPDMVYDPETKRVTDIKTGESFESRYQTRSSGNYLAGIAGADGASIYVYELKDGTVRHPDGSIKRTVWQVLWARRGDYRERFGGSREAGEKAEEEAQHDSLERLAQFLRAKREGISIKNKGRIIGEVVIVDRRMEDTSSERNWE